MVLTRGVGEIVTMLVVGSQCAENQFVEKMATSCQEPVTFSIIFGCEIWI